MTKKQAKEILLKFVEENKYKSDWNGFLSGAISTYLEPIDEKEIEQDYLNRSCAWLNDIYLGDYVTDKYGNGMSGNNKQLVEDFRKAMRE